MADGSTVALVAAARDLDKGQNERLRPLVDRAIEKLGGNQGHLTEWLRARGVRWSQSAISGFNNRRQGTSFPVAFAVCEFLGEDPYAVLKIKRPAESAAPTLPDPLFRDLMTRIAIVGLQSELTGPDANWRTSTVIRAAMTEWDSPDGRPRGGWRKALESIESGEADRVAGGAEEAIRIGKERAGKRRPLEDKDR